MRKGTAMVIAVAAAAAMMAGVVMVRKHIPIRGDGTAVSVIGGSDGSTAVFLAGKLSGKEERMADYTSITMEEAQQIFEKKEDSDGRDYIILDVRREDEYAQGHIPGAVNLANGDITDTEPAELTDKDQTVYVYCRSGNRSRQAAAKLAAMGYTHIIECGGILDWTGEMQQ